MAGADRAAVWEEFAVVGRLLWQPGMRFRVLGPLEVRAGDSGWAGVSAARQRALLAVLLLRANRVVAAEWLVEQLWDGRPHGGAANQLQVYVSRLRRRLGDPRGLVPATRAPGYRPTVGVGNWICCLRGAYGRWPASGAGGGAE